MRSPQTAYRMLWSWKAAFVLLLAACGGAGTAALLELTGLVEPGSLLEDASEVERWVVICVATLAIPFGWTCLQNAYVTIDEDGLTALGFGLLGHQRRIALRDVKRWGYGKERNRSRRHTIALFETGDRRRHSIKLEMYEGRTEILNALEERLGAPAPTRDSLTGLRFVD